MRQSIKGSPPNQYLENFSELIFSLSKKRNFYFVPKIITSQYSFLENLLLNSDDNYKKCWTQWLINVKEQAVLHFAVLAKHLMLSYQQEMALDWSTKIFLKGKLTKIH